MKSWYRSGSTYNYYSQLMLSEAAIVKIWFYEAKLQLSSEPLLEL